MSRIAPTSTKAIGAPIPLPRTMAVGIAPVRPMRGLAAESTRMTTPIVPSEFALSFVELTCSTSMAMPSPDFWGPKASCRRVVHLDSSVKHFQ